MTTFKPNMLPVECKMSPQIYASLEECWDEFMNEANFVFAKYGIIPVPNTISIMAHNPDDFVLICIPTMVKFGSTALEALFMSDVRYFLMDYGLEPSFLFLEDDKESCDCGCDIDEEYNAHLLDAYMEEITTKKDHLN